EVLPAALLGRLSELKDEYRISVIGLPEWDKFANLESVYLLSLGAHIFMSSYIDGHSDHVKGFYQTYRKKYLDEPLTYALNGFDAGYFFLGALMNFGKDFPKCLDEQKTPLIQNQYRFEQKENGGYDNTYWNILKYEDYRFINRSVSYY
ncbi:MAG: hypothetical protein MUC31_05750, partial [Bacteroidales bacterium]|nr:hypothetical protein [Bacteroidales bacterium]